MNLKYFIINILNNRLVSDKQYAEIRYFLTFRKKLNLKNPKTFNEKIQWIKLYNRRKIMTRLADKKSVRDYVSKKIGSEYLNELLATYSNTNEYLGKRNKLPRSYVLKTTQGSGWSVVLKDRDITNKEIRKLDRWISSNYYNLGREWCYRDIKPQIICEKYICPRSRSGLLDYKFFCFHGEPKFIQVDIDRFNNHKRNFYDTTWEKLPVRLCYEKSRKLINKPKRLKEMLEVASALSNDFLFARVDLYCEDKVYFGEITFYPGNGFEPFYPDKHDYEFGAYLKIPK